MKPEQIGSRQPVAEEMEPVRPGEAEGLKLAVLSFDRGVEQLSCCAG